MKIWLTDVDELVTVNNLKEITSPVLFQRGNIPHPEGLISNEIFGITTKDRKSTFAYIDLHGHYFAPHVYKLLKALFSGIDGIVSGTDRYVINDGQLVKDAKNGDTGLEWLYTNWKKIDWNKKSDGTMSMRQERIDLLMNTPVKELFITKQIVIPAFYRDITTSAGGGGETSEINNLYTRIIRQVALTQNSSMFDFTIDTTIYAIQNDIVAIYDYFKSKVEKKQGLIRKYLMGKTVDNAARSVITGNQFHDNTPEDAMVNTKYSGVPLSQLCGLVYPFLVAYIKQFFEREFIETKYAKQSFDITPDGKGFDMAPVELDSPETYFSDKYINNLIDSYWRNPECRFDPIELPVKGPKKKYVAFTGSQVHKDSMVEVSDIARRPMTITDLIYIACEDVVRDKYCMVTRYPVDDPYHVFYTKIRVVSTYKTMPMMVNAKIYPWYPVIDMKCPKAEIGTKFIDSLRFSVAYLEGIGGDYDGDQCTIKVLYTQEANAEIERAVNNKSYFLNTSGNVIRVSLQEPIQTFYTMTKDSRSEDRFITKEETDWILSKSPRDFTFDVLVKMFGVLKDDEDRKKSGIPHFIATDKITIPAAKSPTKSSLNTTVGKWVTNQILFERNGLTDTVGYVDVPITDKQYHKVEAKIADALLNDRITIDNMNQWLDVKEWYGQQMHGVVCTSFSPDIIQAPKEIKELRAKLVKEHEKELKEGNTTVAEQIGNQLVKAAEDYYKKNNDYGYDLYASGARGSMSNNYKNNNLFVGAVKNMNTGKYEIIDHGFMDGMNVTNFTPASNTILNGAYAKSVATAETGYLAKELLAALQTEILDEKDSDCGSKGLLNVHLTEDNIGLYKYRYIVENNKLVLLTPSNFKLYVGKTVKLRSPMFCVGKRICNHCAGDIFYMLKIKNAGLTACTVASCLTNLNMKKFHSNQIKSHKLDLSKII